MENVGSKMKRFHMNSENCENYNHQSEKSTPCTKNLFVSSPILIQKTKNISNKYDLSTIKNNLYGNMNRERKK